MKGKGVSALRSERGLHPGERCRATGCGTHAPDNDERKTDTMKTYILRNLNPVQPQKTSRPPRPKPAAAMVAKARSCSLDWTCITDSIAVSLAPSDSTEVRRYGIIGGEHEDVLKLAKKLADAHPEPF